MPSRLGINRLKRQTLPDMATFPRYFWVGWNVTVKSVAVIFLFSKMTFKTNFNYQKTIPDDSKRKADFVPKTNWWTPLWRGLIVEPTAKHYKAMGSALWLYLYLLVFANRATGKLFRRNSTIAADIGVGSRTVSRWLHILKTGGYIEVRRTGRSLQISITKWKPIKKW